MDEPLSNLDAKLRVQTRTQIASLQRRLGVTTVYVTHDQVEAMTMGDRVAVMKDGLLQQVATPRELYERPANVFVAGFIGSPAMNLLQLPVTANGVSFGDVELKVEKSVLGKTKQKTITVGLRPEDVKVAKHGLPLVVDVIEELGADAFIYGNVQIGGVKSDVTVRVESNSGVKAGDTIHIEAAGQPHLFDVESGERLN